MNNLNQITHVQVSVGSLPEWYVEAEHDALLEQAITEHFQAVVEDVTVAIDYNYQQTFVTQYNEDGDVVWESEIHDLTYAFEFVKNN